MIRRELFNNETAAPAMTHSAEDEDRRRNPVKRVTGCGRSGVLHGDPSHGTAALFMEASKLGEETPTGAPHLTAVEQSR